MAPDKKPLEELLGPGYGKTLVYAIIFMIVFGLAAFSLSSTILGHGNKDARCALSPFNKYSNSTEARYFNGHCYVSVTKTYQTKEVCTGTIFKDCYESSEEHTEFYTNTVCFDFNTGELC